MNAQIVLENIGIRLPNRVLFEGINWSLYEGMRVSLAGRNGSGKSTLMKILAGHLDSSEGKRTVVGGKNLRIGYLDQSLLESSVLEALRPGTSVPSPHDFLVNKLVEANPESEASEYGWQVRKILAGLGFNAEWMDRPMRELSGGWLLRVFISLALLKKPHVLLLDEPTNHLDLSSIQWLEEFLTSEYEGSLVLITHDVSLQKRTTDALAILHGGRFYYRTHQQDYLSFRESLGEEKRLLEKQIETLDKKIQENMDFVYKFRAKAQTAARAQSKLKIAETFTEEQKQLKERLARVEGFAYNLKFRFRSSGTGGKFPFSLKNVSFRYKDDSPWILKHVHFDIARGARVAIIGDNGTGKTTLLNVLAQRLSPEEGTVEWGHAAEIGYFGQHQIEELSLEDTVIDNLKARAIGVSFEELRGWLGAFGFCSDEDIQKKARVLSGGERARLALLRILLTRINVLLLDEPTNHLDIETKDLLKQAIREFDGTVVLVSHDRDFISDIAERTLYLSANHDFTDHFGTVPSFFEKYPDKVRHIESKSKPSQAPTTTSYQTTTDIDASVPTLSYEERKKVRNQIKSLEKKFTAVEAEIENLGKDKERVQALISQTDPSDTQAIHELVRQSEDIENTLHGKMIDWEKWGSELEALKKLKGIQ